MTKILICLDNQPERYHRLRILANQFDVVLVTTCRKDDLDFYLTGPHQIIGICLTFEMPFGTGGMFAGFLAGLGHLVVVVDPVKYGMNKLKQILSEKKIKFAMLPCDIPGWEEPALDFFGLKKELEASPKSD